MCLRNSTADSATLVVFPSDSEDASLRSLTTTRPNHYLPDLPSTHSSLLFSFVCSWLGNPCGVSFGFGGRLISFSNDDKAASAADPKTPAAAASAAATKSAATVHLRPLITEPKLLAKAETFQVRLAANAYFFFSSFFSFCVWFCQPYQTFTLTHLFLRVIS
jgi:hypothetical protein